MAVCLNNNIWIRNDVKIEALVVSGSLRRVESV